MRHLDIALSVLSFTASDYPFSTFKRVFQNEILRQKRWFKFSHCDPFICINIPAAPAYGVYTIFQGL